MPGWNTLQNATAEVRSQEQQRMCPRRNVTWFAEGMQGLIAVGQGD